MVGERGPSLERPNEANVGIHHEGDFRVPFHWMKLWQEFGKRKFAVSWCVLTGSMAGYHARDSNFSCIW